MSIKQKNNIKKTFSFIGLLIIFNIFILAILPFSADAAAADGNKAAPQTTDARCKAYKAQFSITATDNPKATTSIIGDIPVYCSATDFLIPLINYALMIAGTITILFLMVGGFWYLTSAGNEEQAEKGKKTLINAVLGLVVIILSFAIVRIISSTLGLGK